MKREDMSKESWFAIREKGVKPLINEYVEALAHNPELLHILLKHGFKNAFQAWVESGCYGRIHKGEKTV